MSDLFILLLAPAGGDELQGVQARHHGDGRHHPGEQGRWRAARHRAAHGGRVCRRAAAFAQAPAGLPDGYPRALPVSAATGEELAKSWAAMTDLADWRREWGHFDARRAEQSRQWFLAELRAGLLARPTRRGPRPATRHGRFGGAGRDRPRFGGGADAGLAGAMTGLAGQLRAWLGPPQGQTAPADLLARQIDTPLGAMICVTDTRTACTCWNSPSAPNCRPRCAGWRSAKTRIAPGRNALADLTETQLAAYFAGRSCAFDLPLALSGTDFPAACPGELIRIPAGQTVSW